jgi:transcriptional regulator with XRE-family HTH domain
MLLENLSDLDIKIREKICYLRKEKNLTALDLSEATGIDLEEIQQYENGQGTIFASSLYFIAKLLEVPVTYFYEEG